MQDGGRGLPEALQLSEFFKTVRNRKLLIFSITMLCLLGTVAVTSMQPRWYRAEVTIRVEKPAAQVALFKAQGSDAFDANFILSQIGVLESAKILDQAATNLKLDERLATMVGYPGSLKREETLLLLDKKMLNVEGRARTDLIDIYVSAREGAKPSAAALAAEIANEIARVYESDRLTYATADQTAGIEKLKEELLQQELLVSRSRDAVENLRQELQIAGVDHNAQITQTELETLRQMERTLSSLKVDAIARKTRFDSFQEVPRDERIKLINAELIPDRNIQDLLQAYMLAGQNVKRAEQRLGEAHPDLIAARENHAQLRQQLDSLLDGYEKSLEIAWLEAQSRVDAMGEELTGARFEQIQAASSKMRTFEEAVEKLRDEENLLRTMRVSLRQREIDFQVPKRTIEILSPATPPQRASSPSWPINVGLSVLLGLVVGIVAAYLMEFIDTSFRSLEDLERKLRLSVLGVVGRKRELVRESNCETGQGEPYRVIQTNLELIGDKTPGKTLAFQSAGPGEGKSTTLHNLAAVMGISGQRILVIDTDLRRPSQHKLFEAARGPGLIEYLRGEIFLDASIHETTIPGVDFMPSGYDSAGGISLLRSDKLQALLKKLEDRYDRILLDSPPVIGISDASLLAKTADGVIFVVQHRRNPQRMTLRAKQIIEAVGGKILGVVLNQVPAQGSEDYNYYTNNYYYYQKDASGASSRKRKAVASSSTEGRATL